MFCTPRPTLETSSAPSLRRPIAVGAFPDVTAGVAAPVAAVTALAAPLLDHDPNGRVATKELAKHVVELVRELPRHDAIRDHTIL